MGKKRLRHGLLESDPLWYKDAIFYELRVGAFQDSDGDGIGDFRGLAERLDYLQDLGVTALWLLPFCPSPRRDDGYDISDYNDVHPDSGTLDDFKLFLRQAHKRGLRVVTELVINHTSDQHPWFQRARRAPHGSRWRDFYVWSDTPEKYKDVRIIFKDFETSNWTWDPVAKAYFWHRFYSHQPDLNFDSADVRRAVFRALDFWFDLGVDGLRLDAIPYLFEREGTNCENLPETHAFLKELRAHVDAKYEDRMLLSEANQWSEDAVAYFGDGDECHMSFHFPVMPRLFMAVHMEDRFPIIDILTQTPPIPENSQWALFLRNHDELTLEMVTDEERDYMYRVYAHDTQARINLGIRRRLAPLLGRDRRRIELLNALLFSLPGTPIIYYGDEIGMGDNFYLGDRNGVRTPMQWSADRNAGFSRANPQKLYLPVILDPEYHYESVNVEAQQSNPHSILWWMKRLIGLRKRYRAFGRGSIEFLSPSNPKVLAFIRHDEDEHILVVSNLSRFVQYVELDLSAYRGMVAVEAFGHNPFPPIGDLPYLLTLGPHSFYWFSLEPPTAADEPVAAHAAPSVHIGAEWKDAAVRGKTKAALEHALPSYLQDRRWFGGKAQRIKSVSIAETVPVPHGAKESVLAFVHVDYVQGEGDTYALSIALASEARAAHLRVEAPQAVIAEVIPRSPRDVEGVLHDALEEEDFCAALLDAVARKRQFKGAGGALVATPTRAFRSLRGPTDEALSASILRTEQSNTCVVYGDRLILKLFRRVSQGTNPDLEIGRFLTERTRFVNIAHVAGAIEYRAPKREPVTVGILQEFVPNEGDGWRYTVEHVKSFFEQALSRNATTQAPVGTGSLLQLTEQEPPPILGEMLGTYVEMARLLGTRTAEMHLALASDTDDPAFAPESMTTLYQRSMYQSMRNQTQRVLALLQQRLPQLPEDAAPSARELVDGSDRLLGAFQKVIGRRIDAKRIRCHGDYHLGQVLYTGKDFVIIDFEGEPARSLTERRLKSSPLRDVAGMLRSLDYAADTVLLGAEGVVRPEDLPVLAPWAQFWKRWTASAFLRAYVHNTEGSALVPTNRDDLELLLHVLLLDKSVYELGYELNNRPDWAKVPLRGILELLELF